MIVRNDKKLVFFSIFLSSFWLGVILYVFEASMPYNALDLPFMNFNNSTALKFLIPEGWGFFTRDPQEERVYLYKIEDEQLSFVSVPNSSPSNFFGINKKIRAMNIELGLVLNSISNFDWTSCEEGGIKFCMMNNNVRKISIDNKHKSPLLCGNYYIFKSKPIPWAWAKTFSKESMPSEIVELEIRCL